MIKVSDFTDNDVGLIHTSEPKTAKLARKVHLRKVPAEAGREVS